MFFILKCTVLVFSFETTQRIQPSLELLTLNPFHHIA
ncbi:MAG: hypothetical protein ACI83B_002526, partial [Sediminicola sp.]